VGTALGVHHDTVGVRVVFVSFVALLSVASGAALVIV
jgi:hypothetical protein